MQVDLDQFIKSALYTLEVDKLSLTIPLLCKKLSVTPHVAKLILMKIAQEKKDQVISVLCILGMKDGVYTTSICRKDEIETYKSAYDLISSIHYYSISLQETKNLCDDVCNSVISSFGGEESDLSSCSHIENPSIKFDRSAVRSFVVPKMDSHPEQFHEKKASSSYSDQPNVKSLFKKAPTKKKPTKVEPTNDPAKSSDSRKRSKADEQDLFDQEDSDEDIIAKRNRLRYLSLYTDEMETENNDTPLNVAASDNEAMEEEPSPKPSTKKQEEVVNGSMDLFARSRATKPEEPRKKRVKKTREVVDKNGFFHIEEYSEEEEENMEGKTPANSSTETPSTAPSGSSEVANPPVKAPSKPTSPSKPVTPKKSGKKQGSIMSFFSKK